MEEADAPCMTERMASHQIAVTKNVFHISEESRAWSSTTRKYYNSYKFGGIDCQDNSSNTGCRTMDNFVKVDTAVCNGHTVKTPWIGEQMNSEFNTSHKTETGKETHINIVKRTVCKSTTVDNVPAQKHLKRVWLIRHGEGEHNVLYNAGKIREAEALYDPSLTEKGFQQARERKPLLEDALGDDPRMCADLIVCSPLRRTLQTCSTMLGDFMHRHPQVPVILHPDIQETCTQECLSHPKETVESMFLKDFPTIVDISLLTENSHLQKGRYEDVGAKLKARFDDFLYWLKERSESRIVVVGHHNVFLFLAGISFRNCEVREFDFSLKESVPKLSPRVPRRSGSDEELDAESILHLSKVNPFIRRKEKEWGVKFPKRLR